MKIQQQTIVFPDIFFGLSSEDLFKIESINNECQI